MHSFFQNRKTDRVNFGGEKARMDLEKCRTWTIIDRNRFRAESIKVREKLEFETKWSEKRNRSHLGKDFCERTTKSSCPNMVCN